MAEDIIRVLRLVEYEGPRSLVEEQVRRSIHGTRRGILSPDWPRGIRITAVTIDTFPQIIEEARLVADPSQLTDLQVRLQQAKEELAAERNRR
jgi:hypothetical protein